MTTVLTARQAPGCVLAAAGVHVTSHKECPVRIFCVSDVEITSQATPRIEIRGRSLLLRPPKGGRSKENSPRPGSTECAEGGGKYPLSGRGGMGKMACVRVMKEPGAKGCECLRLGCAEHAQSGLLLRSVNDAMGEILVEEISTPIDRMRKKMFLKMRKKRLSQGTGCFNTFIDKH